jgi:outer membrane immunogenic protein
MSKVIYGSAALVAFAVAGPALAADIGAAPAYKVPPAAASTWSGFYAGLGLGFRASRTDAVTTSETVAGVPQNLADGRPTGASFDGLGFRTSSFIGYNWQFAPQWVAGLEGDVGFADQSTTRQSLAFSPGFLRFALPPDSLTAKTEWDASLRARLGFLLTPATLAYATGGIAWQRSYINSNCANCPGFTFSPAVISASSIQVGWTVGGGIETALGGNWFARAEYRYADFGATPFTIVWRPDRGRSARGDDCQGSSDRDVMERPLSWSWSRRPRAAGGYGGNVGTVWRCTDPAREEHRAVQRHRLPRQSLCRRELAIRP